MSVFFNFLVMIIIFRIFASIAGKSSTKEKLSAYKNSEDYKRIKGKLEQMANTSGMMNTSVPVPAVPANKSGEGTSEYNLDNNVALNRSLNKENRTDRSFGSGWTENSINRKYDSSSVHDVKQVVRMERERMRAINNQFNADIARMHMENRKLIDDAKRLNR